MRNPFSLLVFFLILLLIVGCNARSHRAQGESQSSPASTETLVILNPAAPTLTSHPVIKVTATVGIRSTATHTADQPSPTSPTPPTTIPSQAATLSPRAWRLFPVIPISVSQAMIDVYRLGEQLGNNPHAFSKVGDCQTMLPEFLGDFDNGRYDLGEYSYLQPVVEYFSGSFGWNSRGVKTGMTASGVMALLWNTWKDCEVQETPLECEYRINRPSFAFISLGTNDANGLLPFEDTIRGVIDVTLQHGIVPILVTKADNAEGDWSINASIIRMANEYQIPVWNFWLAVQPLPKHGLRSPEHLTYGEYTIPGDFSKPENMQYAYNVRNLNALQVLDVVWRAVTGQPRSNFQPTPITYLP